MGLEPLNSPAGGGLGSLAQSARGKELNQAKWVLIVIGILSVAVQVGQMATLDSNYDKQLREMGLDGSSAIGREIKARAYAHDMPQMVAFTVASVAILVAGCLLRSYPIPMSLMGLILYAGGWIVGIVLNPDSLKATAAFAWVIKICIILALINGVKAAFAYKKAEAEEAAAGGGAFADARAGAGGGFGPPGTGM